MKRKYRRILKLTGILTMICLLPAFAAEKEDPVGPGFDRPENYAVSGAGTGEAVEEDRGADLPSWMLPETKDVVVVTADQKDGSRATVTYYKLEEDWKEIFSVRGIIGKAGLAEPEEKREGDKKTPSGAYSFNMAFGIKEDPGSIMEYHKISQGDVWVDDSASIHYNRMVNINNTKKDWNSAENLASMSPWYDYCLALDYNEEQVSQKGSAIFVHCLREEDWGTSGCIGIPEQNMKTLLQNVDINSRIIIKTEK